MRSLSSTPCWQPPVSSWHPSARNGRGCDSCALDKQLSGNDLPDAWLAAAVEQLGEHLVSFDRDFRKLLSRSRFTHLKA